MTDHLFGCLTRQQGGFSKACGDGDIRTAAEVDDLRELLPRSEWVDGSGIADRHSSRHIYMQRSTMCTPNSLCGVAITLRSCQGLAHKVFDPEELFCRVGGRLGAGTALGDILNAARNGGIMNRRTTHTSDYHAVEAEQNKVLEVADLTSWQGEDLWDAIVTAMHRHYAIFMGLDWNGRRGAGHAIQRTRYLDGMLWGPNTWGRENGADGFDFQTKRDVLRTAAWYGVFAVRLMSEAKDDEKPPF